MNTKFLKENIDGVTIELLKEAISFAYNQGHISHAPLGCSGDDYILYGKSRRQEISVRLHSVDVKLLVTDNAGNFLFHGGYDTSLLPISFISEQYYSFIQNVKHLLENTSTKKSITEHDKEEMLKSKYLLKTLFY